MKTVFVLSMLIVASTALAQILLCFECPDGTEFWASFDKGGQRAMLHYMDAVYELPRAVSASGERFSDGAVTLWMKGDVASLYLPDGTKLSDCSELAALPFSERRLLEFPVRSSEDLDIAGFNSKMVEAAGRGETWTRDSMEAALRFIELDGAPYESITRTETPLENPNRAVITAVHGRLLDDSISAIWHRIELARSPSGDWTLIAAYRAYLCQRGRQMDFFAADPCP